MSIRVQQKKVRSRNFKNETGSKSRIGVAVVVLGAVEGKDRPLLYLVLLIDCLWIPRQA